MVQHAVTVARGRVAGSPNGVVTIDLTSPYPALTYVRVEQRSSPNSSNADLMAGSVKGISCFTHWS